MSRRNLDLYYAGYENLIMIGDFDTEPHRFDMKDFCESYKLSNLNEEPTCYKNPEHPSCMDLILTNCPRSFQNLCVIETGLSDFHKMTFTLMKSTFEKFKPKVIFYRNFKNFSNDTFR